jgi:hypothetical protein
MPMGFETHYDGLASRYETTPPARIGLPERLTDVLGNWKG